MIRTICSMSQILLLLLLAGAARAEPVNAKGAKGQPAKIEPAATEAKSEKEASRPANKQKAPAVVKATDSEKVPSVESVRPE